MKTETEIIQIARQVIQNEISSLNGVLEKVDRRFSEAAGLILNSGGKVVVSGVGKSAIIAQKIAATMNSTGTTAVFLHAADAIHGDLGLIQNEDVIILLSKSGETPELKALIPLIKARRNKLIAITGNVFSYLAQQSDVILDTTVPREACPNNLAPTASTTAQLVAGDALSIVLLECRGFTAEDFARVHPGGALGKQLLLKVEDIYTHNEVPVVKPGDDLTKIIVEISAKRLGATAVLDNGMLLGIITDGDLRRMLLKKPQLDQITAKEIMTPHPKATSPDTLLVNALEVMREHNITQLPVVDAGIYKGVIHIHDIIKEGII